MGWRGRLPLTEPTWRIRGEVSSLHGDRTCTPQRHALCSALLGRTAKYPPLFALRVADRRVRTCAQIREFGTGALKREGGGPNEGVLLRTVDCFRTRPRLGLELVEGAPSIGLRLENGGGVLNADAAGMVVAA